MRARHSLAFPLLSLLTSGCTHLVNDSLTGKDKAQHIIASAAFAAAGAVYGAHQI